MELFEKIDTLLDLTRYVVDNFFAFFEWIPKMSELLVNLLVAIPPSLSFACLICLTVYTIKIIVGGSNS